MNASRLKLRYFLIDNWWRHIINFAKIHSKAILIFLINFGIWWTLNFMVLNVFFQVALVPSLEITVFTSKFALNFQMFTQNVSFEMGHNCEFFPAVATGISRKKAIKFSTILFLNIHIYHCFKMNLMKNFIQNQWFFAKLKYVNHVIWTGRCMLKLASNIKWFLVFYFLTGT